jgi:outer membrane protein assembly factor BamA
LVTAALSGAAFPVDGSGHIALLPFPLISSDSDNGTGFGAVLTFFYEDGTEPYRFSAVANVYETTLGMADDFINFDWLDAFGSRFRLAAEVRLRNENNASYFGSGNTSPPIVEGVAGSHYTYGKTVPAIHIVLRHPITSRWFWYVSYLLEDANIRIYPGSVVQAQLPTGYQGGLNAPVTIGAAYDTRDSEVWTTSGSFDEFALRGASVATGSQYTWAGGTIIFRHYWSLPGELVLADQLLIDVQSGQIPFYDLDTTGTLQETTGLGGNDSLRGFVKDRFLGDVKLMDNLELRRILFSFHLFGDAWHVGATAFAEAGRVYDHLIADGAFLTDGPPLLIHWDVGLGPRLVFGDNFLLRFDVGASVEGPRYYLTVRNLF